MTLQALIDKQDSFEIVRDQIAGILVAEIANQKVLAVAASKDPLDFDLDVFIERDWPIERWLNADATVTAATVPIVTVSLEQTSRDASKSSVPGGIQIYQATYLIDVMARGITSDTKTGDKEAHLNCHAGVRLVRNILSATENSRLLLNLTNCEN